MSPIVEKTLMSIVTSDFVFWFTSRNFLQKQTHLRHAWRPVRCLPDKGALSNDGCLSRLQS